MGLTSKTQDGFAFWQLKKLARPSKDAIATLEQAWERYREHAAAAAKDATGDARAKIHAVLDKHAMALVGLADQVS